MSTTAAPQDLAHWRHRGFVHLDPAAWQGSSLSPTNRFLTTAIIDLLALSPRVLTFVGNEACIFRLFRMLRILGLARLGRFSSPLQILTETLRSRRYELVMSDMPTGILASASIASLQRHRHEHVHEEHHG